LCMVYFACIYVSSLAGGRMFSNTEHPLPPARLLTKMHEKCTIQNCVYKLCSSWWTHEVRNM